MKTIQFKRAEDAFGSGTSLQQVLSYSIDDLIELFGKPDKNSYTEPEKGYSGEEWTFISEKRKWKNGHILKLYFRWNECHLGARNNLIAELFCKWLETQNKVETK